MRTGSDFLPTSSENADLQCANRPHPNRAMQAACWSAGGGTDGTHLGRRPPLEHGTWSTMAAINARGCRIDSHP